MQKVCDDQRCHANLPATESCGVNTNPSTTSQLTWEFFSSTSKVNKIKSDLQDTFYWPSAGETSSFQSTLALPSATPESKLPFFTPAVAGAMILGMSGLSILLYKNCTWLQAIVNTGSRFLQRYWDGGKTEEAKMVLPACSSDRRYTLFPYLSNFCSKKNSSFTKTTSITLH